VRIAHLADLHLGFRQFDKQNRKGANQREADVADALRRAITAVIAAQPDVVLLAGDLFHSVRPTNPAIVTMFAELQRLRSGVPTATMVAVAGDHDSPRSSETGFILPLYGALDVKMAMTVPARFPLADGWSVTAVPVYAVQKIGELRPEGSRNILLAHGEARRVPQQSIIGASLDGWAYVALGHYHVCTQVAPRAWYAGSLEYVSTTVWSESREQNMWGESQAGCGQKGWLLVELADGAEPVVQFQPVETRRVVDLEPLDAEHLSPIEIDVAIAERATDIDGALVRLVVNNISRDTQSALNHTALRALRARALHLRFDWRRPPREDTGVYWFIDERAEDEASGADVAYPDAETAVIADRFMGERLGDDDVRQLGQAFLGAALSMPDPYL
jgi:exonuclease SbcD